MHPLRFVKAHPVGFVVSALTGMVVGPWVLNMVGGTTGVNVNLPTVGG
jgi:hypothetical protein